MLGAPGVATKTIQGRGRKPLKYRFLLVAGLGAMPAVAVAAAEFPKQGTANYTTYYVTTASKMMPLGGGSFGTYEVTGFTRNDDGKDLFNNMGVRCLGTVETTGGVTAIRGACTEMDQEGDQAFTTYEAKGNAGSVLAGTHVFVGGTGKYAGITGKAEFTRQGMKGPDSTSMAVVPHHATWSRP
jgi:hypothetical protein